LVCRRRLAAFGAALGLAWFGTLGAPAQADENGWSPAVVENARVGGIWSFAVDPENPLVVLAASHTLGLLRSADGGARWAQPPGAPSRPLWVVAFDPFNPKVAYAGSQGFGLFKSSDSGLTWAPSEAGLRSPDVRGLDFGKGLVAAATGKGVFISQDGGSTWYAQGLADFAISAVAVYAKAPPYGLLAGVDNAISQRGYLFKNVNLAANWTSASEEGGKKTGFPSDLVVASIAAGPIPAGSELRPVLVGTTLGLYRSDDGAGTFSAVGGLPGKSINSVAFNPNNADQVFAASDGGGSEGGVFRSVDRGASWTPIATGLPTHQVLGIAVCPTRPAQVLAGLWDPAGRSVGLYRYQDQALTSSAGAAAAPSASAPPATSRPSAPAAPPAVSKGAPVDARARLAGLLLVLVIAMAALLLLARRWRMAREDRLSRE